jgi:hypothetical protein
MQQCRKNGSIPSFSRFRCWSPHEYTAETIAKPLRKPLFIDGPHHVALSVITGEYRWPKP